jgi:hypothetical protein
MPVALTDMNALELELLRRGVDALSEDRHRCSHCARTPLIGERVYHFEDGLAVCELCRVRLPREPLSSEIVRHSEHGHAVRLSRRAA